MIKTDFFSNNMSIHLSVGIDRVTITQGTLYLPIEGMVLHRTPLTLALDEVFRNCPRRLRTNDGDISTIAFTQESTLTDTKQSGRIVTHQLYQPLYRQHAGIHQFQHGDQRELNHWHS